jgi:hypothetical protein
MTPSRGGNCLLLQEVQALQKRASRRGKRNIEGITTGIVTIQIMREDTSGDGGMMMTGAIEAADQNTDDGDRLRILDHPPLLEERTVMIEAGDQDQHRPRIVDMVEQIETGIMTEGGAETHLQSILDLPHRTDDENRLIDESLILRVEMTETTEEMVPAGGMGQIGTMNDEIAATIDEMIEGIRQAQRARLQRIRRQSVNGS